MRILHLTLSKKPFEVMVTGEKWEEFRRPSKWIKSRLEEKTGSPKEYDLIKFINGYGSDKPYFICEFDGFYYEWFPDVRYYSNGLEVNMDRGDIVIKCGKIIEKGNL